MVWLCSGLVWVVFSWYCYWKWVIYFWVSDIALLDSLVRWSVVWRWWLFYCLCLKGWGILVCFGVLFCGCWLVAVVRLLLGWFWFVVIVVGFFVVFVILYCSKGIIYYDRNLLLVVFGLVAWWRRLVCYLDWLVWNVVYGYLFWVFVWLFLMWLVYWWCVVWW